VPVETTELSDGWVRLTPKGPMHPGEYAILPVPTGKGTSLP